jgi:hypothetical protein
VPQTLRGTASRSPSSWALTTNRSIPLRAGANGRKRPPTPETLRPPDHYGSTVTVVLIDGPCTRQTIEYMPGLTATNV